MKPLFILGLAMVIFGGANLYFKYADRTSDEAEWEEIEDGDET